MKGYALDSPIKTSGSRHRYLIIKRVLFVALGHKCYQNNVTEWLTYLKDLIKSDCLAARERLANASKDQIDQVDPSRALTLQDVETLANGGPLVQYDTMVLYGQDERDQLFAADLIERAENAGLKGKIIIEALVRWKLEVIH